MRRSRLTAALATLTLTAALATTATAAAAPTAAGDAPAAPPCAKGYICVEQSGGVVTLVPEGRPHDFDPPVRLVSVANSTSIPYCLAGSYNTGVAPGGVFEPTTAYTLRRVTPSGSGACLTGG
ncbi:hypothetical protein O7599_16430 [Streptomyces sp. WMMC500]|uniref:hypothetical protein n=1 Tax=Streptomyces sp. WMMC500 TaxID=3015154 RepID=UPI00248BC347|nr:hypothetical protein [Streptomyces sp. WMMC500]WBB64001.1 hypothetical protein O7599_16430 [Streptomyces sp. WMMC500]